MLFDVVMFDLFVLNFCILLKFFDIWFVRLLCERLSICKFGSFYSYDGIGFLSLLCLSKRIFKVEREDILYVLGSLFENWF